jgi:hypothetical protein
MNAITARYIHIDVRAVNPGSHFVNIHASDMSWHTRLYGLMSVGIADVAVSRIRPYHRPVASGYSVNSILPGVTLPRGRLF